MSFDAYVFKIQHPEYVILPKGKTKIGDYEFCNSDAEHIIIPNTVISIGDYAFAASNNLTSITIPDSVECIGVNAFKDCRNLTSIKISYGMLDKIVLSKIGLPKNCQIDFCETTEDDNVDKLTRKKRRSVIRDIMIPFLEISMFKPKSPTKPNFNSLDDDFVDGMNDRMAEIRKTFKFLEEQMAELDDFIIKNNN